MSRNQSTEENPDDPEFTPVPDVFQADESDEEMEEDVFLPLPSSIFRQPQQKKPVHVIPTSILHWKTSFFVGFGSNSLEKLLVFFYFSTHLLFEILIFGTI